MNIILDRKRENFGNAQWNVRVKYCRYTATSERKVKHCILEFDLRSIFAWANPRYFQCVFLHAISEHSSTTAFIRLLWLLNPLCEFFSGLDLVEIVGYSFPPNSVSGNVNKVEIYQWWTMRRTIRDFRELCILHVLCEADAWTDVNAQWLAVNLVAKSWRKIKNPKRWLARGLRVEKWK